MAVSAYIANSNSNNVSVIDTGGFTVLATVTVGNSPRGVCVTPDLSKVFVSNFTDNTVSVINAATNTVGTVIAVGTGPGGIAVTPDGSKVLVTNFTAGTVSVISVASLTVIGTVTLMTSSPPMTPWAVCISPDGSTGWVSAQDNSGPYVLGVNIAALTNPISVAANNASGSTTNNIQGICITPDGSHVFATGRLSGTISIVATATNTFVGTMLDLTGQPHSVCVMPNASKGFWTNSAGNIYPFNPATFAVSTPVTLASGDDLTGIAPTSDSLFVFVADAVGGTSSSIWKVNAATPGTHSNLSTSNNLANGVGLSYYPVPVTEQIVMIV